MLSIPDLPILLIISAIMIKREVILPLPPFVNKFLSGLMLAPEREAQKVVVLVLILMIFGWMGASRLMRGMALSLAKQDFVEALRVAGASDARIIFRHIIPNGLAPILVNASLALGGVIVLESALSFLALGVQEPTPTWGNMLSASQSYMFQHPWLPLIPGIPLVIVAIGFNFIGDGLRDALGSAVEAVGDRNQESGDRRQESGVRDQGTGPGVRNLALDSSPRFPASSFQSHPTGEGQRWLRTAQMVAARSSTCAG